MTRLISSTEIGEAWENINADWPAGRFQELRRLVKDTLHDAQLAVEAFEDAARQRANPAARMAQKLLCPLSIDEPARPRAKGAL